MKRAARGEIAFEFFFRGAAAGARNTMHTSVVSRRTEGKRWLFNVICIYLAQGVCTSFLFVFLRVSLSSPLLFSEINLIDTRISSILYSKDYDTTRLALHSEGRTIIWQHFFVFPLLGAIYFHLTLRLRLACRKIGLRAPIFGERWLDALQSVKGGRGGRVQQQPCGARRFPVVFGSGMATCRWSQWRCRELRFDGRRQPIGKESGGAASRPCLRDNKLQFYGFLLVPTA